MKSIGKVSVAYQNFVLQAPTPANHSKNNTNTECCHFLGYSAVQSVCEATFRRNVLSQSLFCLVTCYTLVSCSTDFLPWRLRWHVPPKRRFAHGPRGAISQKMATFITTTVRTSNLATPILFSGQSVWPRHEESDRRANNSQPLQLAPASELQ
jgi:hypothetical protein